MKFITVFGSLVCLIVLLLSLAAVLAPGRRAAMLNTTPRYVTIERLGHLDQPDTDNKVLDALILSGKGTFVREKRLFSLDTQINAAQLCQLKHKRAMLAYSGMTTFLEPPYYSGRSSQHSMIRCGVNYKMYDALGVDLIVCVESPWDRAGHYWSCFNYCDTFDIEWAQKNFATVAQAFPAMRWILYGGSKGATTIFHLLLSLSYNEFATFPTADRLLEMTDAAIVTSPILSLWRGIEAWSGYQPLGRHYHRVIYTLAPIVGQNVDRYDDAKIMAMHPRRFPLLQKRSPFVDAKQRHIRILLQVLAKDPAAPLKEIYEFYAWYQSKTNFQMEPLRVCDDVTLHHGHLIRDPVCRQEVADRCRAWWPESFNDSDSESNAELLYDADEIDNPANEPKLAKPKTTITDLPDVPVPIVLDAPSKFGTRLPTAREIQDLD